MFRILIALVIAMTAAGCGVDSLSAAATAAALKKKELEEGKKTMAKAQEDIQKAMDQNQKNAEKAAEVDK